MSFYTAETQRLIGSLAKWAVVPLPFAMAPSRIATFIPPSDFWGAIVLNLQETICHYSCSEQTYGRHRVYARGTRDIALPNLYLAVDLKAQPRAGYLSHALMLQAGILCHAA